MILIRKAGLGPSLEGEAGDEVERVGWQRRPVEIRESNSSPHHPSKPEHLTFRVSVARLPWGQGSGGGGHR